MYYAVRKPGWSLASLAVLGLVGSVIWVSPAIGLGLLLAPGLYVVWGNSRRVMADLLPASEQVVDENGETSTLFRRGQVRQ